MIIFTASSFLWLIYGLFIMRRKCQLDYIQITATRGYDLTSKAQTLEALQNAFTFISRCEIYLYYEYILLM